MLSNYILEVKNVTKIFRIGGLIFATRFSAVDNVNISLPKDYAEIVSLVGESGSGKTTLARMILGIIKPTSGNILYNGKDIFKIKGKELKEFRKSVQPIFQNPYESVSPFEKVYFYLISTCLKYGLANSKNDADNLINETLNMVGLNPSYIKDKYPHEFSGGELQRIMIARALLSRPRILIADEPVSMIDASLRMEILNIFLELKKRFDMSVLYITHDLATSYYISDKIAIMHRGNIVEYGSIDRVLNDPLHPYTKILLESIPVPDPDKKWKEGISISTLEIKEYELLGCKFAFRCPFVKKNCYEKKPPDIIKDSRMVKCWLYY